MTAPRVLFIGLDAADESLLRAWADAGELPNVARLLAQSQRCPTQAPPAVYLGGLWPSLVTGWQPDRHGYTWWERHDPQTYGTRRFRTDDIEAPTFWQRLDDAGLRTLVVDVPLSRPAPGFGGVHLVDWGAHDPDPRGFVTNPPGLAAEITARHGQFDADSCDRFARRHRGDEGAIVAGLVARIAARERLFDDLVRRESWDLAAVVFSESHCVGHQCWHLHDPGHYAHERAATRAGDPMLAVYKALDGAVGRLLDHAGPDTRVMLLATHGFRTHPDAGHLAPRLVRRLVRHLSASLPAGRPPSSGERLSRRWLRTPRKARKAGPVRRLARHAFDHAFVVPNGDGWLALRLNVAGRDRFGRLAPGPQTDAWLDALQHELSLVRNPGSDRPAFKSFLRRDTLYRGPHADDLADLFAEWDSSAHYPALHSPTVGRLEGPLLERRTGDHRPEGLALVSGPGQEPGDLGRTLSITDLAPTLCAWLGVEMTDVDGRVAEELLEPAVTR